MHILLIEKFLGAQAIAVLPIQPFMALTLELQLLRIVLLQQLHAVMVMMITIHQLTILALPFQRMHNWYTLATSKGKMCFT